MIRIILLVVTLCIFDTAAFAADIPKPLAIGSSAPEFNLPGVDGRNWTLADFKDAKVLVVVFTCNHCPTAQSYEQRIIALASDYRDKGVALVAISPNDAEAVRLDELGYTDLGDSLDDMKLAAKDRGFNFPYLYDGEKQAVSRAYGAVATPHVFVFDADRKLRYQGRVDDSDDPREIKSHDARNAIEAVLAGRPVPVETTKVFGCSVKWSDKREQAGKSMAKWNQEQATLEPIDAAGVKELVKNDSEKVRLINVWATWCGPCVAEMPDLVEMHRMYRKRDFEIITISADKMVMRDKALAMLNEHHASMRNYIFDGDVYALLESLDPQWPGPLPHTIIVLPGGKVVHRHTLDAEKDAATGEPLKGPSGRIVYRHTGQFDPLELKRAIVKHIGRTYYK